MELRAGMRLESRHSVFFEEGNTPTGTAGDREYRSNFLFRHGYRLMMMRGRAARWLSACVACC